MLKPQISKDVYFGESYFSADRFTNFGNQLAEITKLKPSRVLEIGVGNGVVTRTLREIGIDIVTLDFDESLNPDIVASVIDLPLADNSFDVVVCCEVLEHIPFEFFRKALAEINRVASNNVVVSIPDCRAFLRIEFFRPNFSRRRYGLNLPFPIPADKHFCDEHYWEIGKKGYHISRIVDIIADTGFTPVRTYRLWQKPNQRFFILKSNVLNANDEIEKSFEGSSSVNPEFESGLVSVIIPTYNRSEILPEAINSIQKQTYRDIEILVIDDGSDDNTKEIVANIANSGSDDVNLKYIYQDHKGAEAARNLGLLHSRGEFIQFLDSDDILRETKVSNQVDALHNQKDAKFAFCAWEYSSLDEIRKQKGWLENFSSKRNKLIDYILRSNMQQVIPICTNNALYRRELCLLVGPRDSTMLHMHETLYNLRVLLSGAEYVFLPELEVTVRAHSGSRLTPSANHYDHLANRRIGWCRVRDLLEDADKMSRHRRSLVAKQFYDMARCAMKTECDFLGRDLIAEGLATSSFSLIWLKLQFLRFLYCVFGTQMGNRFFEIVKKILRRS